MSKPIAQVAAALLLAATACFAAADARLIDAVKRRDPAMVARLIEQGAAVNGRLADGSTALAWAVYGDDKRVARLLLKAGAAVTVNAATDYGETALTLACLNGDGELVEELLLPVYGSILQGLHGASARPRWSHSGRTAPANSPLHTKSASEQMYVDRPHLPSAKRSRFDPVGARQQPGTDISTDP